MDAQSLYEEARVALDSGDMATAHQRIMQSLQQDSQNDQAWVLLAHTLANPQKKLQSLERALRINPNNAEAQQEIAYLQGDTGSTAQPPERETSTRPAARNVKRKTTSTRAVLSRQNKRVIVENMKNAARYMGMEKPDKAIEAWTAVLAIQPDHEQALKHAVQQMFALGYHQDARDLVNRAIDSGTRKPSIYLTAIDLAKHAGDSDHVLDLEEVLVTLPKIDSERIAKLADNYAMGLNRERAIQLIELALERRSDSPTLLMKMGEIHEDAGMKNKSLQYYELAAQKGTGTKLGKEADKLLADYTPVLTDRERGNMWLAWREAVGLTLFFLLSAMQDAGMNFALMGPRRWLGVLLGFVGSYLLVTAASAPQQKPLAKLLGGSVPKKKKKNEDNFLSSLINSLHLEDEYSSHGPEEEPTELPIVPIPLRLIFGVGGLLLIGLAFSMVFSTAIEALQGPMKMDTEFFDLISTLE